MIYMINNRNKVYSLLAINLTLFLSLINAQTNSNEPELFDEFGTICSEDLSARLDAYAATIYSQPNSKAVILFEGKIDEEGTNLNYMRWISGYLTRNRGIDPERIRLHRLSNKAERRIRLYIHSGKGFSFIPKNDAFSYDISKTILFETEWADVHKTYSKQEVYLDGMNDLGCGFAPNNRGFSKHIRENRDLNGYIVIFNKKRTNVIKIKKYIKNRLVIRYGLPKNRLKFFYGGIRKEPEIEFWLVKKGGEKPEYIKELK